MGIVEVHGLMAEEMERIVEDFLALPIEARAALDVKACETTVEFLVSVAAEQYYGAQNEDLEHLVRKYRNELRNEPEFGRNTLRLTNLMQKLVHGAEGAAYHMKEAKREESAKKDEKQRLEVANKKAVQKAKQEEKDKEEADKRARLKE